MIVKIGIVTHRHGIDVFAGHTDKGLNKQLADYCREWWGELGVDHRPPRDDSETIEVYFRIMENNGAENLERRDLVVEE